MEAQPTDSVLGPIYRILSRNSARRLPFTRLFGGLMPGLPSLCEALFVLDGPELCIIQDVGANAWYG